MFLVISTYCEENDASRDNFPDDFLEIPTTQTQRVRNDTGVPTQSITDTIRSTYNLFHERRLSLVGQRVT